MPQVFHVLRCYKCSVFQVHQTKKSNKWECKLCGEKQSIKRHYGLGTAKDCRLHVQKLNGARGEIDILKNNKDQESDNSDNEDNVTQPNILKNNKDQESDNSDNEDNVTQPIKDNNYKPNIKNSKWLNYIEETEPAEENTNENRRLGDAEVVSEVPKKRRKQCGNNLKRNPKVLTIDHGKIQENYKFHIASPIIEPNGKIDTESIQSKIPKLILHSEDLITKEEPLRQINHNIKNKFIPSVLNKNSKWAKFTEDIEDAEDTEQTDISPSQSIQTSHNDLMFVLCDDTDLDNVLNI